MGPVLAGSPGTNMATHTSKHIIRNFSDGWRQRLDDFLATEPHSIGGQTTGLLILDVHRTALNRDGSLNLRMVDYVRRHLARGYEVVFLSYDSNDRRMSRNYRLLNRCTLYRGRKKIFVKKRKKYAVIHAIDQRIFRAALDPEARADPARIVAHRQCFHLVFIDDNHNNIDNIDHRLMRSTLDTYYSVPARREQATGAGADRASRAGRSQR